MTIKTYVEKEAIGTFVFCTNERSALEKMIKNHIVIEEVLVNDNGVNAKLLYCPFKLYCNYFILIENVYPVFYSIYEINKENFRGIKIPYN